MDQAINIEYSQVSCGCDEQGEARYSNIKKAFTFNFDLNKKNHQTIVGFLQNQRLYEPDVAGFMTRIIKEGDYVVDIGANVGFHTMLMASLVGKDGFVTAYEPAEENISEITANQNSNGFTNVKIHQKILGENQGEVLNYVYTPSDSGTSYVVHGEPPKNVDVRLMSCHTLDEELAEASNIKLIKMDVEGSELSILKGAKNLLRERKVKYWIVEYCAPELHRMGGDLNSLRDYMSKFGLEMFVLDYAGCFPKHFPRSVLTHGKYLQNLLFADIDCLGLDWVADDVTFLVSGGTG